MVVIVRMQAFMGITMMTGFLCFQDYIKKSIVITNFTQSLFTRENSSQGEDGNVVRNQTAHKIENIRRKYDETKQSLKQSAEKLKEKGQGSYYLGLKKKLKQSKENNLQDNPILREKKNGIQNNEDYDITYSQVIQPKNYLSIIGDKLKTVKENLLEAKENAMNQYRRSSDQYNRSSLAKSEKLIDHHLKFGTMALVGSVFMPQTYALLSLAYFFAYQMYFFSDYLSKKEKYRWLQNQRFTPIWYGFMLGGGAILVGKFAKTMRFFAR